jgi:trypsin-like peptidase
MRVSAIARVLFVRTLVIALLTVQFPVVALAQTLDDLSMTVAYLRQGNRFGTGFFILADEGRFLVTAEHVANLLTAESSVTVRGTNDTPINVKLGDLVPGAQTVPWQHHNENDVAVLRLLSVDRLGFLDKRFFPIQQLPTTEVSPARDHIVVMFGFPSALGTSGRFSPISAEAKTASGLLRLMRPDTKREATFFVLDRPSIGGFSGGPVFMPPTPMYRDGSFQIPGKGNPTFCVGLVSLTIGDTGGTLAAVVPANAIVDTIKAAGSLPK